VAASSSELVLGIDLGTTYSTAAAVVNGKVHFALDGRGEACVPSVVHFPKSGPAVVGADADRLRSTDPQNTVFGIKRLVGRRVDSPQGRLLDACAAFKMKQEGAGEAAVVVRTGTYAASEVAACVLRYLRERAEARFGRRIGKAVVTVPVTADDAVREAMVRCGRMAGLEVLRIVAEPCAGAVAQAAIGAEGAAPLLVYDFGGGTFDATVVRRTGGRVEVLAAGGDDCLGGDDLDLAFARWVASGVYRVHKLDLTRDAVAWVKVQRHCELVKRALSSAPEARYRVSDALGSGKDLDVTVRREHLSPEWSELVRRSLESAAGTVREAGMTVRDLRGILLIGGTTFVPQVRAAVAAGLERPCLVEGDPQTAVARGAAILAAHPELLQ
jgi:molecular chaperone DnaK (HSP70)